MIAGMTGAAVVTLAKMGYDFAVGQAENYAAANGPDIAWGVGQAAAGAFAQGALGENVVGKGIGFVAGEFVGAEAGAYAANGAAVDLVKNAVFYGKAGYDRIQGQKETANENAEVAEQPVVVETPNKDAPVEQPAVDENTGYLEKAGNVAGWGVKRFAKNWATVKIVDVARDTAFNGVMGAATGMAGNAIGGVVGYVPACMAGWKVGAMVAAGPAAAAATVAVDVLAPVAINYAAPIVANAVYDAGKGTYDYMFGAEADENHAEKQMLQNVAVNVVAQEQDQEPEIVQGAE